jgi:negative regulator of sigma E activity
MNATARLPAITLAAVFTLAMLLGVDSLATGDNGAQQVAQQTVTSHS